MAILGTQSEIIGNGDAPGVGMGFSMAERLFLQAVAELLPGEVGRFADGDVVVDYCL